MELTDEALGVYDRNGEFHLDAGPFRIFAGGDPGALLQLDFELEINSMEHDSQKRDK